MTDLKYIISSNFKQIKSEKNLSLDNIAKLTGVSKSMLGQIERGEANPTIGTIWKIANGLKISFTSLLSRPQMDIEVVRKGEIESLNEDNGKYRNYPIFPFDDTRRFEIYSIELDCGSYLSAEAHSVGAQEYITIFSGELTVRVNNEEYTLNNGDSIRFKADLPHTYHNSGKEMTRLSMIIYYPN